MKLLTYNIYFNPNNLQIRTKEICKIILENNPDFISLQEVTNSSYQILHDNLSDYYYFISEHPWKCGYGCLILSKIKPLSTEVVNFPSRMNRNLLICKYNNITISTSHLESLPQNHTFRKEQLNIIKNKFKDESNIVFMGDTNLVCKSETGHPDELIEFKDLNNGESTYNYFTNSLIKGLYQNRIDRIFFKGSLSSYETELIGVNKISEIGTCPSDHYGLLVEIKL
jgi:endonuclease/exonuclease/phosphatase family metal-dependent hydrolase